MNSIILNRTEAGCYEVLFGGVSVGNIRRNDDSSFWSNRRWTIDGLPARKVSGGVNSASIKLSGFASKEAAAHECATMNSLKVILAQP